MRDGRGVIGASAGHLAKRELRRIMEQPGHRDIYRRRKCTVEPVFGQIQVGMGFRRFFYRGKENVGGAWNLVCAAFNVKKLAALVRKAGGWTAILPRMGDYLRFLARWIGMAVRVMVHQCHILLELGLPTMTTCSGS
ncbi:MAG TPA: hypothetical protein DEB40_12085 [Elusimicrobia bacterium]|nr:hypothetical protein [Elusimicrobiota bacterium]HBT62473.1 hypothetical protein [Elusimicrobiota bacterium]